MKHFHLLGGDRDALEAGDMKQRFALIDQRQVAATDENPVNRRLHDPFQVRQRGGNTADRFTLRNTGAQ